MVRVLLVAGAVAVAGVVLVVAVGVHGGPPALRYGSLRAPAGYASFCAACGLTGAAPVALRRPLRLPIASVARRCPQPPARALAPGLGPVVGAGPVYVEPPGQLQFPILTRRWIRTATVRFHGWSPARVLWVIAPSYRGPVLVRGGSVGGRSRIGFGDNGGGVENPAYDELQIPPARGSGWRESLHYTLLHAPGCYAYQIDGTGFTETIVFQAVVSRDL